MKSETKMKKLNIYPEKEIILKKAEGFLLEGIPHITDKTCPLSPGDAHEFYSNGDYWWPNPDTESGLPYIRRDGESNPENFNAHRHLLRKMRTAVSTLAMAYKLTGDERYSEFAVRCLYEFFLDEVTYMKPHLKYAQAIPGVCDGRGIGIIDTLHLTELPFAIRVLEASPHMTADILAGLKGWFADYLAFMTEDENGITEMNEPNNHSICWHVQALSFAGFVGNGKVVRECVERYKTVLLPRQMREDGGFTDELNRTKPYGYSIFVLDNITTLVHLGTLYGGEDLWNFELDDGRSLKRGLDFLYPYLVDKSKWFLPPDVEHHGDWPAREAFMLLAAITYADEGYLSLYNSLPYESDNDEVRRSTAIRQPFLLL